MTEYLKTFLIGGSIISLSKYVSTHFPPAYSGLIGAFPVSLVTSFFLLNDEIREKFFKGAILSDILVTIAVISIILIRHYNKTIPLNYITIFALILWISLGITIIKFGYKQ